MANCVENKDLEKVSCDLCGSNSSATYFEARDWNFECPGEFNVVECLNCSFTYLNPQPLKEKLQDYYPNTYYTHQEKTEDVPAVEIDSTVGLKNIIKARLKEYFSPKSEAVFLSRIIGWLTLVFMRHRVVTPQRWGLLDCEGSLLDIGCGSGEFLYNLQNDWLVQDRFQATGIDVDTAAIQAAKSRGIKAEVHAFPDQPYHEPGFDVITMRHSLEHMVSPTKAIREARRLLHPQGRLIIEVPNFASLGPRLVTDRWSALDAPRHLNHFTPATLKKLLEDNGFGILSCYQWPGTYKSDLTLANLSRYFEAQGESHRVRKQKQLMWKIIFYVADRFVRGGAMSISAKRIE